MLKTAAVLLAFASFANAATIQFVGVPGGVNDGSDFVLPYQITVDGVTQLVACYDIIDQVAPGDVWQANLLTVDEAAATGYFSGPGALAKYERVAWLSAQTYGSTDQQIGLQHAIWNVFGSASVTPETSTYQAAADAAASAGYVGFDFNNFLFIEQVGGVPGQPGTKQAFVLDPQTPEPGTMLLCGAGALLLGLGRARRSSR